MQKKIFTFLKKWAPAILSIFFIGAGLIAVAVASIKIPDFNSFMERKVANSTKIYDRTGEIVLFDIHENIRRTVVPLEEMGNNIQKATIALEDAEFYEHNGVRIKSIIRAVLANLKSGQFSQGGSTITQQIVKNTLLSKDKKISRKIKEWVIATKLEKLLTKDEILEMYLNEAPYGGTVYGVKEAAYSFFAKEPKDLTLAESAYLASLPQAPSFYSPYGKNKDRLEERKNFALKRMLDLGFITEEEYFSATKEEVAFQPEESGAIKAPHFVFFVKEYLENKYGEDVVREGGLQVITTLDYELQKEAERIVKEHAIKNQELYNASNAASVSINPQTGEIVSMVGSRDYFDEEIDGKYNIATAMRQPGSSFKPFAYVTGFKEGYRPETTVFDVATEFQTTCSPDGKALPGKSQDDCYSPENYDGLFKGPISLRSALAESRNIPSVKLLYLVGVKDALETAEKLGISTLTNAEQYGLTLVLGGGEVKLLDMVSAYSVFANTGKKYEPTFILKVTNQKGDVLEEVKEFTGKNVYDEEAIKTLNNVLSDNNARAPLFGQNSFMYFPGIEVAGKTGTTNSNRDAWMMGYTPSIVIGVWSGNNDNTPMKKGSAISGAIWREIMAKAIELYPPTNFAKPNPTPSTNLPAPIKGYWQGGEVVKIDKISGKLATEYTPEETTEEFVITNVHSILHWIDKNNPLVVNTNSNDSQYNNWEYGVQKWWSANKYKYQAISEEDVPTSYDDVHTKFSIPIVEFNNPPEEISSGQEIELSVDVSSLYDIEKVEYYFNEIYIGESSNSPDFEFSFTPTDVQNGLNTITAIAIDEVFNRGIGNLEI